MQKPCVSLLPVIIKLSWWRVPASSGLSSSVSLHFHHVVLVAVVARPWLARHGCCRLPFNDSTGMKMLCWDGSPAQLFEKAA